jgi:alpha-beta hydrolase superfamily lysophospholipase
MNGAFLELAPEYETWLHAVEPVRHPERYTHAAILLVNGETDQAIPLACAQETTRVFTRAFAAAGVPDRFRAVVLPGAGHTFPDEARHQVLTWWYRWLVPPRSAAVAPLLALRRTSG